MKPTLDQLQACFRNNFLTYYSAHVAHVNTVGRNFVGDHRLLKDIYEARQEQTDTIAEFIRTLGGLMIDQLQMVITDATIDDGPTRGSADDLLEQVRDNLLTLADDFRDLREVADEDDLYNIANYADEQVTAITGHIWFLDSTLGIQPTITDATPSDISLPFMQS